MAPELKPWYAIATPHSDIREGRLDEAVFAADLWKVVQGEAPDIYLNTADFFAKTYLTAGLTNVLKKVARALSGDADAGDRIVSLQTSFGGGKTHALVALWHLAKHADVIRNDPACSELNSAIGAFLPKQPISVAVFTNKTTDATQGRHTPEGLVIRTMWGELAYQLGGIELYKRIEANDQARTVPQGLFGELLKSVSPCLILLDEVADYCIGANGVPVGNLTLSDQTVSFAQQLSEAVSSIKEVAVVATLPASHLEVAGSERGVEILNSLERRFGRMSADVKPVADQEIYDVVRRRLFDSVGDLTEQERVATAYMAMYTTHKSEVPTEAARSNYKDQLVRAYPFHPMVIDALFLRWGSHPDFQRTRGVLRLLASVVGDLWKRRNNETQAQSMILPCHIRWDVDALHAALTRMWGSAYDSVVAADIIGEKANAMMIDEERGGEYFTQKIAQGLASAALLGSFGGQGERSGYSNKELKLCVGRPELNWNFTDGAITVLEEKAFYLHSTTVGESTSKRYWFATKPTLNKLIVQYRAQIGDKSFDKEISDTIRDQAHKVVTGTDKWKILVSPDDDLPEQKSLTLLIMSPEFAYSENGGQKNLLSSPIDDQLLKISLKCGQKERLFRNTLIFLLPSHKGLNKLRTTFREVAALELVKRDYYSQLDKEQQEELLKRLERERKNVQESLGSTYTYIARVSGQTADVKPLTDVKTSFADHLGAAWSWVIDDEWVLRKVGSVTLEKSGLVLQDGGIRVKDALESMLRYTDKPMLANRDALLRGLVDACKDSVIGIARGITLNNIQKQWCGETITLDPNEDGLWIIPKFTKVVVPPEPMGSGSQGSTPSGTTSTPTGNELGASTGSIFGGDGSIPPATGEETVVEVVDDNNKIHSFRISGNVATENWTELFRCFIQPTLRLNLKKLQISVSFSGETHEGNPLDVNDPSVKGMKEAAKQLGLKFD